MENKLSLEERAVKVETWAEQVFDTHDQMSLMYNYHFGPEKAELSGVDGMLRKIWAVRYLTSVTLSHVVAIAVKEHHRIKFKEQAVAEGFNGYYDDFLRRTKLVTVAELPDTEYQDVTEPDNPLQTS